MHIASQIAKHLRDVYFGGNWTSVNLKQTLADVDWQQAVQQPADANTIATLVYHMSYYVSAVKKVLEGAPLNASDKLSFDHPEIASQQQWEDFLQHTWAEAEAFAVLIAQLPDSRLEENFTDEKYGTYYRNLQGIVEHCHYHLGQIVMVKKMLRSL